LTVLALKVSGGDVVESGVAEYDMERLVLRDVLALGPDDDGEPTIAVGALVKKVGTLGSFNSRPAARAPSFACSR
jgi:hypothetical protein